MDELPRTVIDEAKRGAMALESARLRGVEFGAHFFHGGTISAFPHLSHIERKLHAYLLDILEQTELLHECVAVCYRAAKEAHDAKRKQYRDALKRSDGDTTKRRGGAPRVEPQGATQKSAG